MKKYANNKDRPAWSWLRMVAVSLIALGISGCYLTEESLQLKRNLTQPLPYHFFLHRDDGSTNAEFSDIYIGKATDRAYDVSSDESVRSLSFEPIDRKSRLYWAQMHVVDEKGEQAFANWLVKIALGKMHFNKLNNAPAQVKSRAELLDAFEKSKSTLTPLFSYSIYDLGNPKDKARADRLLKADKNKPETGTLTLDQAADIDLTRAQWRAASDEIKQKVALLDTLDKKVRAHGFTGIEQTALPFYRNTQLIRAGGAWQPETLRLYFLYDGESLYQLNGKSPVIHQYNASHPLILNEDTIAAYLWFFGFFVRSENQPFLVLNSSSDTYYPNSAKVALQNQLARSLKTPVCVTSNEAGAYECRVLLFYSGAVFDAKMKVESSGTVSMLSDQALHTGFSPINAPVSVAEAGDRFALQYHSRIQQITNLRTRIAEKGETPYLLVNGRVGGIDVPPGYMNEKGKVVLNISDQATTGLVFTYDRLKFGARFSGQSHTLDIPLLAMEAIYSRETGQGLMLTEASTPQPPATTRPGTADGAKERPARPSTTPRTRQAWVHDAPIENGVKRQYLYNFANTALGNYANPFLRVECRSDGVNVMVMWGKPMQNMYAESSSHRVVRVSARFGRAGWKTLAWALSSDRFVAHPPSAFNSVGSSVDSAIFSLLGLDSISKRNSAMYDWNARSFVNQIKVNDSLVLSARDSSNREVTLNVDLSGYRKLAGKHFPSGCR